jgi:hypothetical protein
MKYVLSLCSLGLLVVATLGAHLRTASAQAVQGDRAPVVVELFTSEGCSSCPPADALLSQLEAEQPIPGAQVIGLEEHVDYWNQQGWMDPYSSAEWTARQQEYDARLKDKGPYTPQMIVDGEKELVGNNPMEVEQTIEQAARQQKVQVSIAADAPVQGDVERVEVKVVNGATEQEKADVWLAVTEDGLHTDVKAGENKGRNLEHASIVRSFQKLGSISGSSAPFVANPQVKLRSNWKKENLHIVVFVQSKKTWRILGAAAKAV